MRVSRNTKTTPEVTTLIFFSIRLNFVRAQNSLHWFVQEVSSEFNKFCKSLICVMMNLKETPPFDCEVRSVVWFLTIKNSSRAEIHRHL